MSQELHHLVVEADGKRVLDCDALNVSIRPDAEREMEHDL